LAHNGFDVGRYREFSGDPHSPRFRIALEKARPDRPADAPAENDETRMNQALQRIGNVKKWGTPTPPQNPVKL
jgi:hypothetical protein